MGDWIAIDGDWYHVKRIELTHTLLESLAGARALWANSVLRKKHPLENLSRELYYTEQWTLAVDAKCFANGLVKNVNAVLRAYVDARPDIFTGWLLVLNSGPVDKEVGTMSVRTKAAIAGLKMGLTVRVQFVNGFLMRSSFYTERSNFIEAWTEAILHEEVSYSTVTSHTAIQATPLVD